MKPMGYTFTPLISYHDIRVENIDIIEDAYGFNSEFHDVITLLGLIKSSPGRNLTTKLIDRIRKQD
jgi:hypothetical protein